MKKFTDQVWEETLDLFEKIIQHPFNQELKNGTLPADCFRFYIYQDSLYLADFARALAITGTRLSSGSHFTEFLTFAQNALFVESVLHESYFKELSINFKSGKAPGCFAYTNYLLATSANEPVEVAVAALLPCFIIYKKVGDYILANQATSNPYQNWIDAYSGEEFARSVEKALAICDELAEQASEDLRARMANAYATATRLEYVFWDSAYKLEQWGI